MLLEELIDQIGKRMDQIIEGTRKECSQVRTGRASIALVDGINVDAYGGKSPIRQLANVSIPDAKTIVVQAWDKSLLKNIERAILTSELGITPNNDGNVIRLVMPPLSEERRRELVKQVKRLGEEGKVSLRNLRRHAKDDIKKAEKDGDVPEDEGKRALDEIQKIIDQHCEKVDQLIAEKTEEIMEF